MEEKNEPSPQEKSKLDIIIKHYHQLMNKWNNARHPTKVFLKLLPLLIILLAIPLTVILSQQQQTTKQEAQVVGSGSSSFVTRVGANLYLNGSPFRFAGTNMYWLGLDENNSGSVAGIHYPTKYNIDDGLDTAKEMGATVVRSNTLGISVGCPACIEPTLNNFNSQAFNTIDYAIYSASQHGIKLIIPLTDGNTPCFYHGCMRTFVNWTYPGSTNDSLFYTDQTVINNFKTYISQLLNHVNAYTGVALKDDPTIMAWESGNEIDDGGTNTASWLTTISQYVKSIDTNHLFIDGGWTMDSQRLGIPTVDMYTRHHYHGGYYGPDAISDDQHYGCLAVSANKVYFVGEYDWTEQTGTPLILSTYLPNVENYQCPGTSAYAVAGDLYWSLFPHHDTYGFETHSDGYTLNYAGTTSWMRTQIPLLIAHARKMNPSSTQINLKAPLLRSPVSSGGMQVKWQGVAGAVYYQVERSNDNGATWTVISPSSSPKDGILGGLTDSDAPWIDSSGLSSSSYRIRAYNVNNIPGPYSSGYDNSNSNPPIVGSSPTPVPTTSPTPTPTMTPTSTPVPTNSPTPTPTPTVIASPTPTPQPKNTQKCLKFILWKFCY